MAGVPLVRSNQPVQEGPPRVRLPGGLLICPSRPGRCGLSLHRTGRMAMLHGLRGWKPVTRVPLTSFSFRPLARPENALLFGLFRAPETRIAPVR
jgi:hypothetical protein